MIILKRKLSSPKDGRKDIKGLTIQMFFRQKYYVPTIVRHFPEAAHHGEIQGAAAPDASNMSERALGVKRANLPVPDDYAENLEAMTVSQALEMGLNQLHEAGCALYIRHKYNKIVMDNFLGDEYVGSETKLPLMEWMPPSVKKVQKLSAHAKPAVGAAGGPFNGKKKVRGGGGRFKRQAVQGGSLPPGFDKPKAATGELLGKGTPCSASSAKRWGISLKIARASRDGIPLCH